ncbi:purine operon repressor, PurR [Caloranaerobacter azorensis DSM 13643]|uniref:Purine operon repressor, PurR n=1 Tax=Caloranaerobacter azorensis DSM 13643 TaxID=1121264 RepID=A0A1M5SWU8_9FIRM|nr:pur operon repressor [Caloranaerobacter azorensis]SHH42975.1 purine operon repressor, PurR [Caloranaerobacter azorensis DSM 13643]
MIKLKRNERIGAIMKILSDRPNHIFTYNYFTDRLNAAKSTISEDIVIIKGMLEKLKLGKIETIPGASGGVKYTPQITEQMINDFLNEVTSSLTQKERIIPGGFIYMTDLLYDPSIVGMAGKIFAHKFINEDIDYVVTVETKGIPIALMTAQSLDVPLVIIRRNIKVTEGAAVNINYVTGSTKKIQTMSLSRKAVKAGDKVLVIDDFMKAGGTAKGICDMMKEFKAEVIGTGVFIATELPKEKLVDNYLPLLILKKIDEEAEEIIVKPNRELLNNID